VQEFLIFMNRMLFSW